MIINGINCILTSDEEGVYYSTEKLLANNILIEESKCEKEEGVMFETWLTLYYYNENNAMLCTLAIEDSIPSIQSLSMVKEVINLFETNSLDDFLNIMRELSVSYMDSSMQSNEEQKQNVRERVIYYFDEYKELVKISACDTN